jgi:hypothetical protein
MPVTLSRTKRSTASSADAQSGGNIALDKHDEHKIEELFKEVIAKNGLGTAEWLQGGFSKA